jgi:chorismate mutase / prephenate dehydratase
VRLRGAIDAEDRAILAALNHRIELVHELHRHKRKRGYPLSDPGREAAMLDELGGANTGPLSEEGLRSLLTSVLSLTRAEVGSLLEADAASDGPPGT